MRLDEMIYDVSVEIKMRVVGYVDMLRLRRNEMVKIWVWEGVVIEKFGN